MKSRFAKFTREQLYDLVWSKPMTKVAEDFHMSDVGVKKICRKNSVPVPPRGHWRRLETGKPVKKISLPTVSDAREVIIRIKPSVQNIDKRFLTEEMVSQMDEESKPESNILVSHFLTRPHIITTATKRALKSAKKDDYGAIKCATEEAFYVRIGPQSLDRALRVIDALVKACIERGFSVRDGKKRDSRYCEYAKFLINGESLGISIEEKIQRRPHKLTKKELADQKRVRKDWSDFSYMSIPKYDYFPTGNLTLKIEGHYGSGLRSTWNDTKRQRIEDRLNQVVVALIEASAWIKQRRQKEEERERRYQKELARREELRRRYEEERQAVDKLEKDSKNWTLAQNIRAYAKAFEEKSAVVGQLESDDLSWLEWARDHADRLDPLCKSKPSALDMSEAEMTPISMWEMDRNS